MLILSIPALGLAFISLLAIYKFIIYPVFLSPLSKIPNAHWSAPISPLWILWTRFKCRENIDTHAAHQKYGSVIRLGPNELSINDVAGLRTVYGGGFEKGQWYSIFDNYGYASMSSVYFVDVLICLPKCTMHVFFLAFQASVSRTNRGA